MHIASHMPELLVCIIYANLQLIFISAYKMVLIMVFNVELDAKSSIFTALFTANIPTF